MKSFVLLLLSALVILAPAHEVDSGVWKADTVMEEDPAHHRMAEESINHLRGNAASFATSEEANENTSGRKLSLVLSISTKYNELYTCNVKGGYPYEDCLRLIGEFCTPVSKNFLSWSDCHEKFDKVAKPLNANWQSWANSCASWRGGAYPSTKCTEATNLALQNAKIASFDTNDYMNVPQYVADKVEVVWHTCNVKEGRPYEDCLNVIGEFCVPISKNFLSWSDCHVVFDKVAKQLNANWQNWANSCASWRGGVYPSTKCTEATNIVLQSEKLAIPGPDEYKNVFEGVTGSAAIIWNT